MTQLRDARPDELARLIEIENSAGAGFGAVGIDPDLPGLSHTELAQACTEGLLWVIADAADRPVAFAMCQRWPETLHLRELDVDPAHMRRGLGRRLLDHVRAHAAREGLARVTLTTFSDVAWNAPMYRRYGFVDLERAEMPEWLRAIRNEEAAGRLAAWPRTAMALTAA
jgi:ribosomal protein S18 acetylase RimI-like enzyme